MKIIRASLIVATLLVGLGVQTTFATHWTSRSVVAASQSQTCVGGVKIDDPVSGWAYAFTFDGEAGTITFTHSGGTLSFVTDDPSHVVTSILIKGGPTNAVLYTYAGGTDSDTGLTAPTNPNNNKPYGVSHVCVFTAKKF
jgi:hypothetical protein